MGAEDVLRVAVAHDRRPVAGPPGRLGDLVDHLERAGGRPGLRAGAHGVVLEELAVEQHGQRVAGLGDEHRERGMVGEDEREAGADLRGVLDAVGLFDEQDGAVELGGDLRERIAGLHDVDDLALGRARRDEQRDAEAPDGLLDGGPRGFRDAVEDGQELVAGTFDLTGGLELARLGDRGVGLGLGEGGARGLGRGRQGRRRDRGDARRGGRVRRAGRGGFGGGIGCGRLFGRVALFRAEMHDGGDDQRGEQRDREPGEAPWAVVVVDVVDLHDGHPFERGACVCFRRTVWSIAPKGSFVQSNSGQGFGSGVLPPGRLTGVQTGAVQGPVARNSSIFEIGKSA